MARKKSEDDFYSNIATKTGGMTLDTAGKVSYFVDTGNLALNYICSQRFIGGGIPGGKITEVYGPPATSKSLLGYCCLASCQRMDGISVLLDCERAGNADFAMNAGHVDPAKLITYEPISIKQVETKIIAATKAIRAHFGLDKPILFVWDSIGVTPSEREWKETSLDENPTKAEIKAAGGSERPGERARQSGDLLRKINPFLNENNATLFVINQTRNKIGVMYGSPETTAGGGEALKFFASCRLRTSIGKIIESKTGLPLGVNLTFQNKKSRSSVPGLKTTGVQLFFESGINPLGGILTLLLNIGRIVTVGKSRFKVCEPYSDGQDVEFTVSVTKRNDIPIEVITKCPKLIDAKNQKQVEDYLALFKGAIDLSFGDSIVEKESKGEEDSDEESDFIAELSKDQSEEE